MWPTGCGGGLYVPEKNADAFLGDLARSTVRRSITREIRVVELGARAYVPIFALLVLTVLIVEWSFRRKINLL